MPNLHCPCGSQHRFEQCCQPLLVGEHHAVTAEQLMRSRYSAYALENNDYLVATWHPSTCPAQLKQQLINDSGTTQWQSLRIIEHWQGANQNESFVTFFARYNSAAEQQSGFIYETSRFIRENNRWYYIDGVHKIPGRNELCPCGSEKKFKKCCAL